MRTPIILSAAAIGLALSGSAMAQSGDTAVRPGHVPGVGDSQPASDRASNIDSTTSHSRIAPRLPSPTAGDSASPNQYLTEAQQALKSHKTGQAQEALERAQTRLLDRSVEQGATGTPDSDPRVTAVSQARQALAKGDTAGANRLIQQAMSAGS